VFLSSTNCTQAAVIVHCRHPVTPGGDGMASSVGACSVWRTAKRANALPCIVSGDESAVFGGLLALVTLTFDLDIQTPPSKRPNTASL